MEKTLIETAKLKRRLPSDQRLSAKALRAAYKNNIQTGSLNNLTMEKYLNDSKKNMQRYLPYSK